MPKSWLPLAALLLASPLAAQQGAPPVAPGGAQLVTVIGMDYAYEIPGEIKAGPTLLVLKNKGQDLHAMALFELPANRSIREFLDTFHSAGAVPGWAEKLGETAAISPGQEAFIGTRLEPGRYALACLIPARDGRAHTEKGMVQMFIVK